VFVKILETTKAIELLETVLELIVFVLIVLELIVLLLTTFVLTLPIVALPVIETLAFIVTFEEKIVLEFIFNDEPIEYKLDMVAFEEKNWEKTFEELPI
jgi:hypothetical protein